LLGWSRRRRPARGALPERPAVLSCRRRLGHVGSSFRQPLRLRSPQGQRPVRSRLQHRKTNRVCSNSRRAPGDTSGRRLYNVSPRIRNQKSRPGKAQSASSPARKRRADSLVAHEATSTSSTFATYATTAKTQLHAVFVARISLVHPKTRQPCIRDPRLLKPTFYAVNATNATRNHGQGRPKKAVHHQ
jgi:hypothetical protein